MGLKKKRKWGAEMGRQSFAEVDREVEEVGLEGSHIKGFKAAEGKIGGSKKRKEEHKEL